MEKGSENYKRKHYSNLNWFCNCFQLLYTRTYLLGPCRKWIYLDQSFLLLFDYLSNSFYLLSNSLGPSSLTQSLQIYCAGLTGPISLYILGLGFKTCTYNNNAYFDRFSCCSSKYSSFPLFIYTVSWHSFSPQTVLLLSS